MPVNMPSRYPSRAKPPDWARLLARILTPYFFKSNLHNATYDPSWESPGIFF
jgi:hypothetical protein